MRTAHHDPRENDASAAEPTPARGRRVAYVMSRFPKLSETFVLAEMLAVRRLGVEVLPYPLLRHREPVVHPDAAALVAEARYLPFLSARIVRDNLAMLAGRPSAYLGALAAVVAGTWRSLNFLGGGLAVFPKVVSFARRMEREGVEHVHCHFANHPALAGLVIHRLTGIPYSFTAHGSDLHVDRTMLREKVREAAAVVTISEYNRRLILDECGEDAAGKVVVVHCGVDTGLFQPNGRRPSAGALRILCVGTLHEVKGQPFLVEACRRLAAGGVPFECEIVGDGPDREMLARRIRDAGLEGRVRLLGARTREEVAALLAGADVLAAPSVPTRSGKREGIPVVLMEAMASGVAVVASRLSGIPELVEHERSGLLVPPGDADALAETLARLQADPALRARLASAGREMVERAFEIDGSARRLAELFSRAA